LEALSFHQLVRSGYLKIAEENPERVFTIDASQNIQDVVQDAYDEILRRYPTFFSK
jgi:dTMP kinase